LIQEGTAIVVSPLIALMKTKLMPSGVYLQREVLLNSSPQKTEIAQVKKRHLFRLTAICCSESLTKRKMSIFLKM
jgi:superfamily II DNA helicase RecQ